jgi:hypothetical protein
MRAENDTIASLTERAKTGQAKRQACSATPSGSQPKKTKQADAGSASAHALLHLMDAQRTIKLSGREYKGAKGGAGSMAWYHNQWVPADAADYGGTVTKENLKILHTERAQMCCLHCHKNFSFNPSTRFRNHLLFNCAEFEKTEAYQSEPVQADLTEEKGKRTEKAKVCIALRYCCLCVVVRVHSCLMMAATM